MKKRYWLPILIGIVWIGIIGVSYSAWTYCIQLKLESNSSMTQMVTQQSGWDIPLTIKITPIIEEVLVEGAEGKEETIMGEGAIGEESQPQIQEPQLP